MSSLTVKDGTEIYYKDWGTGQPIMFPHGWPLSADDWDSQMLFFLLRGYRVIAHDRRGHGRSTQTDLGNDWTPMLPTAPPWWRISTSKTPSMSAIQPVAATWPAMSPNTEATAESPKRC